MMSVSGAKGKVGKLAGITKNTSSQLRLYFQGHHNIGILPIDKGRDALCRVGFGFMASYLRSLSDKRLEKIILNTCSLSPLLATMAHWADWSLHRQGFHGNLKKQPRFVFVKADYRFLELFYYYYLPRIKPETRFILSTGDSDATLPLQVDKRFKAHSDEQIKVLRDIHNDPRVVHWYAQNIDTDWPKLTAIPLGYWELGGSSILRHAIENPWSTLPRQKPLKVFCANRIRPGAQWEIRRTVAQRAINEWSDLVDYYDSVSPEDFFEVISRYPFVMCVGGGGLDPSPKAWTALLAGCIPIVEWNATTEAYRDLPVIIIDSWKTLELDAALLHEWLSRCEPHFTDPLLRSKLLEKLSMGYWLNKVRGNH